jgi:hypothetical protein
MSELDELFGDAPDEVDADIWHDVLAKEGPTIAKYVAGRVQERMQAARLSEEEKTLAANLDGIRQRHDTVMRNPRAKRSELEVAAKELRAAILAAKKVGRE